MFFGNAVMNLCMDCEMVDAEGCLSLFRRACIAFLFLMEEERDEAECGELTGAGESISGKRGGLVLGEGESRSELMCCGL